MFKKTKQTKNNSNSNNNNKKTRCLNYMYGNIFVVYKFIIKDIYNKLLD